VLTLKNCIVNIMFPYVLHTIADRMVIIHITTLTDGLCNHVTSREICSSYNRVDENFMYSGI
jgi:hypothetical protein